MTQDMHWAKEPRIEGLHLFEPKVFGDARGFFLESWNERQFASFTGLDVHFVQDNHSKSSRGVIRGLHYQIPPHAQGKLVRVIEGEVLDLAVDIRKSSPTYGHYVAEILSANNKKQMWIPEGFAHAFLTLSDVSQLLYKTTDYYHPESERCILWSDNTLKIDWPQNLKIELSKKDLLGKPFLHAETFS